MNHSVKKLVTGAALVFAAFGAIAADPIKIGSVLSVTGPAAFLTMENYLLQQIDGSAWKNKFISLMDRYPEIPATEMGFPEDWRSLALWS